MEYDAISGAVLRAARRHQIAVPKTEMIYALLKLADRPAASSGTQADWPAVS